MPPRKVYRKDTVERVSLGDLARDLSTLVLKQADEPNILGYKPHAKQEIFHKSEATGRWFLGGNRSGKSVAGVVEDIWWATKRHPFKSIPSHMQIRGRVVGSDFTNGIETILFPIFQRWVLPSDLVNGSWEESYNKAEKTLYFGDGSFIEFRSCDQDLVKHAGTSRHFIHFDEEPPRAYWEENLVRLVDTNGFWWLTMTPVEGMTWVHDDLYAADPPISTDLLQIVEVEMDDNTYLSTEGKNAALGYLNEDARKAREKGSFVSKGGRVLKKYSELVHCKMPTGWRPPSDWTVYTSQDHGYRTPSAVVWCAVRPDGRKIVTFHEIYEKEMLVSQIAALMRDFEKTLEQPIYMRTGDPAMKQRNGITGTSILYEYAQNGILIGTEGIPRDENIGIDRMNSYLERNPATGEPFWELTKDCKRTNWEFKKLSWHTYASAKLNDRNNPVEKVHDRDNHSFDAHKYFFTFMRDLHVEKTHAAIQSPEGSYMRVLEDMAKPFTGPNPVKWEEQSRFVLDDDFTTNTTDYGWGYGD